VDERASTLEGVVSAAAWHGRRVLVTGHTGFKGAWLAAWLRARGAQVAGLALDPPTEPSLHALIGLDEGGADRVDIRNAAAIAARVHAVEPEVVFHLAAQSLVRAGFADPVGTYAVNVLGTAHLLDALRSCASVRVVVVATSDKVYEPRPGGDAHDEDSPLGGVDPYSASKAAAELVTASYRRGYLAAAGVAVATVRAGNVFGGGDWAADRVVPDVVRALATGRPVALRHPGAVRPWQHVLDPLAGYLRLAERLLADGAGPTALNFGPSPADACNVGDLVDALTDGFGGRPGWRLSGDDRDVPETATLRLDASRARRELEWSPRLPLAEALRWTTEWYLAHAASEDVRALTHRQLTAYEDLPA
jgi:CDP-glucose 4,6-dehydratase